MYKIIKEAVRARDQNHKLNILKYPLNSEELEKLTTEEVEKLEEFINDYYLVIYFQLKFIYRIYTL